MKTAVAHIIWLVLFLLNTPSTRASEEAISPLISIPYELKNNRIKMELMLGGNPMRLMLDTGATTSVFFTQELIKDYITSSGPRINFPAFNTDYNSKKLRSIDLYFEKFNLHFTKSVLIDQETPLSAQLSLGYDGIIGQELFQNYIVEIDPREKTVNLYPHGTDLINKYRNMFNINMVGTKPHIKLQSKLPWENRRRVKEFLIDTGYPGAMVIWNPEQFEKAAGQFNESFLKRKNTGIVSYANFRIGHLKFLNVSVFLGANPPKQLIERDGIIGGALLNHFKYAMDFRKSKLWTVDINFANKVSYYIPGDIYTPNDENYVIKKFHSPEIIGPKQVIHAN